MTEQSLAVLALEQMLIKTRITTDEYRLLRAAVEDVDLDESALALDVGRLREVLRRGGDRTELADFPTPWGLGGLCVERANPLAYGVNDGGEL